MYEAASGQKVNYSKSSIFFSPNASVEIKNEICDLLDVPSCSNHGKYLGTPSLIGRNKSHVFAYVKEKAWTRFLPFESGQGDSFKIGNSSYSKLYN